MLRRAAILHDMVQDSPYTLAVLKREFDTEIAAMMAEHVALARLRRRPGHEADQVMATIRSANTWVIATMMTDRLHNMQTLHFLPQAKQLRKAREVLDTYLPAALELSMPTVRSQLQALACAALIRNQSLLPPRRRVIIALDIRTIPPVGPGRSETEVPFMLYKLFEVTCACMLSTPYSAGRALPCR